MTKEKEVIPGVKTKTIPNIVVALPREYLNKIMDESTKTGKSGTDILIEALDLYFPDFRSTYKTH